ncbi:hypothetical protein HanHA300_Chr14g0537221 [Helianthus annuus]|nr:hypothetical protein HanHA300_Chr14g0537221 [Helianthus annuus]KAJ0470135.1 hypothetical protein HanIR_Chr14g0715501 [Helianthus annuus]KAJ0486940.1 hypothetical protein HanHA89_Chr14g0585061 [Helianthus annuus]
MCGIGVASRLGEKRKKSEGLRKKKAQSNKNIKKQSYEPKKGQILKFQKFSNIINLKIKPTLLRITKISQNQNC